MRLRIMYLAIGLLALGGLAPAAASSSVGVIGVSAEGPCTQLEPVPSGLGDPFGYFDGKTTDPGNAGAGRIELFGWALDDDGVRRVDILVDGITLGRASYGNHSRPDVAALFPGFPDSSFAGFRYELNSTQFLNGLHVVTPQVVSEAGEVRNLNSRVLQFTNLSHNLRPFGRIETPEPNRNLFGTCNEPLNLARRYSVVTGWALDLGVETNEGGIGWVELLIDGVIHSNTRLNCDIDPILGYHNCYGLRRLDIESNYPFAFDAPNAGYRFLVDVGELVDLGYSEGHHVLTVRAGDQDSQVENIDAIPVTFVCEDDAVNEGSYGEFDELGTRKFSGTLRFTGWAIDPEGVAKVKIYVDGTYVGDATRGFLRPRITELFPGVVGSPAPAWVHTFQSAGVLADGQHQAQAIVVDRQGEQTLIGEIVFKTEN